MFHDKVTKCFFLKFSVLVLVSRRESVDRRRRRSQRVPCDSRCIQTPRLLGERTEQHISHFGWNPPIGKHHYRVRLDYTFFTLLFTRSSELHLFRTLRITMLWPPHWKCRRNRWIMNVKWSIAKVKIRIMLDLNNKIHFSPTSVF